MASASRNCRRSSVRLRGINGDLCRQSERRLAALETSRLHAQRDGSFFTGSHKRKYDNLSDGKCVLCELDDDITHRCLHCPGLVAVRVRHPDVRQLWDSSPVCLRERLLPPRNPHFGRAKQHLYELPLTGNHMKKYIYFTDGSCTADKLSALRLASWLFQQLTAGLCRYWPAQWPATNDQPRRTHRSCHSS